MLLPPTIFINEDLPKSTKHHYTITLSSEKRLERLEKKTRKLKSTGGKKKLPLVEKHLAFLMTNLLKKKNNVR